MIFDFDKSFTKDLKKRKTDKQLMGRVRQVILAVEEAPDIHTSGTLKS